MSIWVHKEQKLTCTELVIERLKAALQEQQRINAAMATTLAAQNTMNPTQATVVPPKAFQSKAT